MSTQTVAELYPTRHPLGLPPGSIRGLLGVMIGGLFYTLLLMPEGKDVPIPIFLYFLLGLILLFFVGHRHQLVEHQHAIRPFGFPHAFLKVAHIVAFAASIGWIVYAHPERLGTRMTPNVQDLRPWPFLLIVTAGAFGIGHLIGRGPWRDSPAFQDFIAWTSLLGMVLLAVETIILIFINPSLLQSINTQTLELILTGIVAFYFGARS